jgi:hypothetical protein
MLSTLPAAVAQERAGDFAEGLKQLAALGLPPMQGAVWVRKPRGDMPSYTESGLRLPALHLKGAVWKLPGDTPKYLDFGSGEELEAVAGKPEVEVDDGGKKPADAEPGILQKMLDHYAAEQPAKPKPAAAADMVEGDVHLLIAALARATAARQGQNRGYSDYDEISSDPSGRCLIFAAQLQAAGQTAAATELVTALFNQAADKAALIDSAIDQLASTEYASSTRTLFASDDWARYQASLKALLAKYPRGWSSSGAVAMLMVPLEKRASSIPPPLPSLPGAELKPEALAKLAAMLEPPGAPLAMSDEDYARSRHINLEAYPASRRAQIIASIRANDDNESFAASRLWVLAPDPKTAKSPNALEALTGMGMDGLAALAAIARDDTLTLLPPPGASRRSSFYFNSSSGPPSDEQIAAQKYKTMARPRTRGEIAVAVLSQVIPTGEDHSEPEPDAVAEAALTFWKENHEKLPLDLALVYLNEGDENQKMQAAGFLADLNTPEARTALEKAILTSTAPADYAAFAITYLTKLGPSGRPFFDAYSKVLHEAFDGVELSEMGYTSGCYVIRQAGAVDNYLRNLSLKVGVISLKDLLAKAMKTGTEDDWEAVSSGLASTSTADVLALLGPAVAKASPAQLAGIHRLLYERIVGNQGPNTGASESTSSGVEIPGSNRSVWKPVLGNTSPLPKDEAMISWARSLGAVNSGDLAALLLEALVFPDSAAGANVYAEIQGTDAGIASVVHTHMDAWVDQKPVPEWPEPDKVPEQRKQEIASQMEKLGAKELIAFANALTLPEKAYVCSLVRGYGRNETPVPAGLAELRLTVVACRSERPDLPHDDELLKAAGIAEGYRVTEAGLIDLLDSRTSMAPTLTHTLITFRRGPMLLGYLASARHIDDNEGGQGLSRYADYFGDATAISCLTCGASQTYRALQGGKVVSTVPKNENGPMVEQGDNGDSVSLKKMLEGKTAVPPQINIEVLTAADAQKLKPANW